MFFALSPIMKVSAVEISATSAVLYEPISQRVIFEKNMDAKMPMASTTKIATCITAIELGNLNDVVSVSKKAADTEGSSIWLEEGEKMSLSDLLYGLMLSSGNDAAVAIAEHIGGNTDEFAKYMNDVAYKSGAYNTNFTNPSGLDDENHYTTALDLAKITAYALKNPNFAEIVKTKEKNVSWEGHEWNRKLKNHNKLLNLYEGCKGVKTGFTKKSGRCLVSFAEREGVQLISVTLKAPDDWNDHIKMMDYGFNNLTNRLVVEKGKIEGKVLVSNGILGSVEYCVDETYSVPLLEGDTLETKIFLNKHIEAPVSKGEVVGYKDIYLNSSKIKRVDLIAKDACDRKFTPTFSYFVIKIFEHMF